MFWIILPIYVYAQFSNTQCSRENILNEYDCVNFVDGSSYWNNSKCVQNTTNQNQTQTVVQEVDTDPTYCNLISISLCASNKNCALINQKCVHFTGCTPFIDNCQNISIQCISNGEQCIEIGKCEEFEDETSCQFDMDGKYCYWDTDKCITASTCEQLSKEFDNDSKCRAAINTCTVAIDGKGCTQSLQNCSDHQIEIQCKSNLQQTQQCFWNGLKCADYVCNEASTTLTTDEQCKKFLSTCTTKENGGCTPRGSCESAKIKEACITDKDGDKCYWNGEQCVDYICENAPDTYKTNIECESFLQDCITDGNGCVEFKNCSSAKIEDACAQETCYWYNNICQTIKCSFAPKTLLTNEECNSFLEGCLTKLDGGCMEYSNDCTDYDVQEACDASINKNECYWTEEDDCVERTCENAPLTLKSFDECQSYSTLCTFTDKCVLLTCENILDKDSCISDYKDDSCTYIESCYNKECSLAEFTTAKECNDYLDSCTLDDSEQFCTTIPQKCINNTKKSTCYKSLEGICVWFNNSCQIKTCFTADTTYTTNEQCDQYLEGCIVSNTIGCTNTLPDQCSDRLKQQNCELDTDECVWGDNICQSRSCTTAKYELNTITNITCRNYYLNCILNNTSDNCQQKPKCEQLVKSNCLKDAGSDGNCIWDGLNCIQQDGLLCDEIQGATNHNQCQQVMTTCTVNESQNGCVELQECEDYTRQNQCVINNNNLLCKWINNECVTINCSDAPDSLSYASDSQCSTFQHNCTVHKDIGGCVDQFINICNDYKKQEDCYKTKESIKQNCFWYNNQCQLANSCVDINFLNSYSTANCETIISDCKVNTSQNGCVQKICTDYAYTNLQDCESKGCSINAAKTQCIVMKEYCGYYLIQQDCYYSSLQGLCSFINGKCVIKNYQCVYITGHSVEECQNIREFCTWSTGSKCSAKNCQITYFDDTRSKTFEDCQNFDSSCTAQIDREQCTDFKDCSSYGVSNAMNACYYGKDGYCTKVWSGFSPATSCGLISSTTECVQIWIDYYEPGICEKTQPSCTDNPTQPPDTIKYYSDKTQCIDKTCSNKPKGTNYTHSICQAWLSICTSTMDGTGCMDMKNNCSDYSYPDCGQYQKTQKDTCDKTKTDCLIKCTTSNNTCIVRECSQASKTLMKNTECNDFLSTCTVGRIGGCEIRQNNCSDYKNNKQCFYDVIGNKCWWNPTLLNCVLLKCENIEKTSSYSTMQQCQSIPNLDCIPRDSGYGCQDNKETCEEFNTQALCTKNKNDEDCQWFNGKCLTKSCETAPLSYNTIAQCLNYYTLTKCTTKQGGGCTEQKDLCDDYNDNVSCTITTQNDICGYNQKLSKCQIKSCLTAPISYTTHQECNNYMNSCTVSVDMQGCQVIPNTCEQMTTAQCYLDQCIVINNKCIERQCQNKPATFNGDCPTYLNSCLDPTIKCKDTICEYHYLPTDQECNEILDTCTSNGVQCIPRKNCIKYTNEISCVKQLDGKKCQWIESTKVCLLRQCSIAPKTLTLHSQCQEYLDTCTVAINGGCMIFDLCTNYKSLEQCQIDKNKQQCVWDTDKCRYLECKDYTNDCENKQCFVDHKRKGYCMQQLKCSEYEFKQNCIIGTDGSCLWIEDKCYKYSKCEDILFTTHEECQKVSKYCTTDGEQCVPITTCDQTNINGGCQIGIDGECIEILVDNIKQCSKYDSCNQIQFTTHEQCYNIKSKCTSNGIECITLDSCDTYTSKISCVINNIGKVIKQNQVMSTGQCVWNLESNVCSDQSCSDIQGTTNSECENQLYSCTSDGKICIDKVKCSDVKTEQLCSIAKSQNSYCFWDNGKCREIGCVDIKNPNSVQFCKDKNPQCTFDGKDCIEISQCNQYKTALSCNSMGTDGMCSWIPPVNVTTTTPRNVCLLMDSCEQSSQDQQSCLQAKTLCNYIPPTNTTASFCQEHTCDTYYKVNNKCNFIYSWDKSTVKFCQLINNVCTEITNPTKFNNNECYQLTAYTYTYNTTSNLCTACAQQRKNATFTPSSAIKLVIFIIFLLY